MKKEKIWIFQPRISTLTPCRRGILTRPQVGDFNLAIGGPAYTEPSFEPSTPDPTLTGSQMQSRGSKPNPSNPTVIRAYQILQLPSHKNTGTLRVLTVHQLIPDPQLPVDANQHKPQSLHISGLSGNIPRSFYRIRQSPGRRRPRLSPRLRQYKMPRSLQLPNRLHTSAHLRAAARIYRTQTARIHHRLRMLAKINCTLKGVFRADSVIPFAMEIFPDNCQF
jgi:hypothetical protein